MSSGLVCTPDINWICYHGCYDFSYFLKILRNETLPPTLLSFDQILKLFFPVIYDIKSFAPSLQAIYEGGGLNRIADLLELKRNGT